MAQVYIKYNPYKLETEFKIDGNTPARNSILVSETHDKRLQEWVTNLPVMLVNELNTRSFDIIFHGTSLDYDDLAASLRMAKDEGRIVEFSLKFEKGRDNTKVKSKIEQCFRDLQEGPIDAFRSSELTSRFNEINNAYFPINVVATMSSGKSTLINALLSQKLMPSKNEACTAMITSLKDNDEPVFKAEAFDAAGNLVEKIPELNYEKMDELNSNPDIIRVEAKGDIPFIDANDIALELLDTPGPNNSQDSTHRDRAYSCINNANNLVLYILNASQLSTNDDDNLLSYVAEQIRRGGKQARDRFLFVINKMDVIDPENEDVERIIGNVEKYLNKHGIDEPQIFPCSAFTALNIRTYLKNIDDVANLAIAERRALPSAANKTISQLYTFIDNESMHLEQYSTLAPNESRYIRDKLIAAQEAGDDKEQALIHSGIYSLEAAIKAYVKKYAKTKKVKDLVDTFNAVLEKQTVVAAAKDKIAKNEQAAKELIERRRVIEEKINNGKESDKFKARIEALDPMPEIRSKAKKLVNDALNKSGKVFSGCGEVITSMSEAKALINAFNMAYSYASSELITEMDSLISTEIVDTGRQMLLDYQEKLTSIDQSVGNVQLDFSTADLVKDKLQQITAYAERITSDSGYYDDVLDDDVVTTTEEEKVYYEKTGTVEEKVLVGTHQEKDHDERVKIGTQKKKVGTRKVKNPERNGWGLLAIWKPWNIDEDVFEMQDVFETRTVMKTVEDYEMRERDVYEERREIITNHEINVQKLTAKVVTPATIQLQSNVDEALKEGEKQVAKTKATFSKLFAEVDEIVRQTYKDLEQMADTEKQNAEELEKNKNILSWLEASVAEINSVLEI